LSLNEKNSTLKSSDEHKSWPVNIWYEEIFKDNLGLKFKIKDYLFSGQSPYQKVDIVETLSHGKLLAHDGMVMVTEKDEFIYHDMITHIPMFTHPNPKNVLVIGGGDGGTVREVSSLLTLVIPLAQPHHFLMWIFIKIFTISLLMTAL